MPASGADIIFGGTLQLGVTVTTYGQQVNSLTFASGAGAFTLSSNQLVIGSGGITNNSSNTQTISSALQLSADQTWNANTGDIVISGTSYDTANSHALTLTGSHAITIAQNLTSLGALTLTGTGNRSFTNTSTLTASFLTVSSSGTNTFAGQVTASGNVAITAGTNNFTSTNTMSATTINVSGGTNTFAGQVNATTINLSSGTSNFTNTGTAAQVGSGGLNVSGNANASFSGNVGSNGGINVTSSGNVVFNGNITSGNLTLNGTGTTTINGASNNITTTTVNSGTLIMNSSGTSTNGSLVVNGGTVLMEGNNQIPTWSSVTLTSGTLNLNNTTQTITNLTITGNSVIDFGTSGSNLSVTGNITITSDVTVTILDWDSSDGDVFSGSSITAGSVVQVVYEDSSGNVVATATWTGNSSSTSGNVVPGGPVPEPATYGLIMISAGIGFYFWRRRSGSSQSNGTQPDPKRHRLLARRPDHTQSILD